MYDWDFGIVIRNLGVFADGAVMSLGITALTVIFGTFSGTILGVMRTAPYRWLALVIGAYVEMFLALPILVLLIWVYYCAPLLIGLQLSGFWSAVVGLSLALSAYVAEIVRSGVLSVPLGHIEAAHAVGMTKFQATIHIVLPQAVRIMIPPLLSVYISTLKTSSLASVLAVYELLHSAQNLILLSYRPLEIYSAVALFYLVMVLPFTVLTRRYEQSRAWKFT